MEHLNHALVEGLYPSGILHLCGLLFELQIFEPYRQLRVVRVRRCDRESAEPDANTKNPSMTET
jgi:hypothetical protein